jgi:hypothetical protein
MFWVRFLRPTSPPNQRFDGAGTAKGFRFLSGILRGPEEEVVGNPLRVVRIVVEALRVRTSGTIALMDDDVSDVENLSLDNLAIF